MSRPQDANGNHGSGGGGHDAHSNSNGGGGSGSGMEHEHDDAEEIRRLQAHIKEVDLECEMAHIAANKIQTLLEVSVAHIAGGCNGLALSVKR